ncbi:MAG: MotA/TolQ/ExbB proton channel family protein [Fibrobacteraceae bacterium]|nr:MotA/TolQ/ExbB proton channel family protein [Fibrobacteraceae bacterium]
MSDSFYVLVEAIRDTYYGGGPVMVPLLFVGMLGFYFLFAAWVRVGRDYFSSSFPKCIQKVRECLETGDRRGARDILRHHPGFASDELRLALDKSAENPAELEDYLSERYLKADRYLQKGNVLISVMASAAPLLGLLGTVTGMVSTFQTITLYGNHNPLLLADGISEALITTQAGLLIAFPLTLLKQRLDDRLETIRQQIELGFTLVLHNQEKVSRISV